MRFRSRLAATRSARCSSWRRDALARGRRHADHQRRRPVESRAGDRRGGGQARAAAASSSPTARRRNKPTANALLDRCSAPRCATSRPREERAPAMDAAAEELRRAGAAARIVIPIGASTPLGAAAFVHAVAELLAQVDRAGRDRPLHLLRRHAGGPRRRLRACRTGDASRRHQRRRIGGASLERDIRGILDGLAAAARTSRRARSTRRADRGRRSIRRRRLRRADAESTRSDRALCARREALFLDPTYTAKAMAGLIARVRARANFTDAGHGALLAHRRTGGTLCMTCASRFSVRRGR